MLFLPSAGGQRWVSDHGRRFFAVAALACLAILTSCESKPEERAEVIDLVNESRAGAGLPTVHEDPRLSVKADRWAQHLRDMCGLEHSQLSDDAPDEWIKLGENVGYGGSISQIHAAYLASPGHRANIMDPAFSSMGAAAVWGYCDGFHRVFTVQVFMKS